MFDCIIDELRDFSGEAHYRHNTRTINSQRLFVKFPNSRAAHFGTCGSLLGSSDIWMSLQALMELKAWGNSTVPGARASWEMCDRCWCFLNVDPFQKCWCDAIIQILSWSHAYEGTVFASMMFIPYGKLHVLTSSWIEIFKQLSKLCKYWSQKLRFNINFTKMITDQVFSQFKFYFDVTNWLNQSKQIITNHVQ